MRIASTIFALMTLAIAAPALADEPDPMAGEAVEEAAPEQQDAEAQPPAKAAERKAEAEEEVEKPGERDAQ